MSEAKIKLSEDELLLVQNAAVILTKNAVIKKAISLFSLLADDMRTALEQSRLPEEVKITTPKISKGENYNGLPYVILDYPRLFTHENIFAIRTLFWWGNYFSITLHLKGIYKEMFVQSVKENISSLAEKYFSICISPDQWRHELEEDNYISLLRITENELGDIIEKNHFLKLSAKAEFAQWDDSAMILMGLYRDILLSLDQH
jgi:hypothetical protein